MIKEVTDKRKNVVIFGATGLTGNELLKLLVDDERYGDIIVVTRRAIENKNGEVINIVLDNFLNISDLGEKLKADLFFVCTGTTIKKAGSEKAFRTVDYEIPLRIAQYAQSLNIPGMVVISSIGANSRSSSFYLRTKGEMEEAVSEVYKGGLKFIRPSLLLGKRDEFRAGEFLASLFMRSLGWAMIGPLKRYRGVKASEVARQMANLGSEI